MFSKRIDSLFALRNRLTRSWSIAFRLVLFFTIAAATLLLVLLGAAYWVVVEHFERDSDRYLTEKLTALRANLAADAGTASLSRELQIIQAADKTYAVRVLDQSDRVVAESPRMSKTLPSPIFPKALSPHGQRPTTLMYHGVRGKVFALVSAATTVGNQELTIELAQERTHDISFAHRFAILLLAMGGCATATCAGVTVLLIRRGLLPLKHLASSIERTGATRLQERVPVDDWPDELRPLAVGYNKMLARLEESFTRLSQFSADLAHELRTPIAILRGEAEGVLTRPRTAEEYREVIESGLEELQRLSGMIDNLLFIARAETTGSFHLSNFDGRAALDELSEFYEAVAQDKGVVLACEGQGKIYGEPTLFRRALINLITNALRFTPNGGSINVSLQRRNGGSEITVSDTGCGISAQHVPHVFNRFFRGDAPRSAEGTGLGLSIVKSIMQIHNGAVAVESQLGKGTVIRLSFPDANASEAHSSQSQNGNGA